MLEGFAVGIGIGLVLAVGAWLLARSGRKPLEPALQTLPGGLVSLRRVGKLEVLRADWSIPSWGRDHVMGDFGRKFMKWLWSENKVLLIFRFTVSIRYDLNDPASVRLETPVPGALELALGKPEHEVAIGDVQFYDVNQGRLLDWLLPRALNMFQSNLDPQVINQLKEAARAQAREEAEKLVQQLLPEAERSAETTIRNLAKSLGFDEVRVGASSPEAAKV